MVETSETVDVAVIGGGLAGLAAAVAIARAGWTCTHLAPEAPPDRRTTALMEPSVRFLRDRGLVGDPSEIGQPLARIRIIDATDRLLRAPEALFDGRETGHEAFGWNFSNAALGEAFRGAAVGVQNLRTLAVPVEQIDKTGMGYSLALADGSNVATRLVAGADGKRSMARDAAGIIVREKPFAQSALVCDLTLERPIGDVSVEFHYPKGPFTLVPAGANTANLVWIDDHDVLLAAKDTGMDALSARFGEKTQRLFGAVTLDSPVSVFPLGNLSVDAAGRAGICLIGESAHAFPPIGAQGLNLSLRDIAGLLTSLQTGDRESASWGTQVSADYAERRKNDLTQTGMMVDTLFNSLLAGFLPAQALRSTGLWALKSIPALRRKAFALGMGER